MQLRLLFSSLPLSYEIVKELVLHYITRGEVCQAIFKIFLREQLLQIGELKDWLPLGDVDGQAVHRDELAAVREG